MSDKKSDQPTDQPKVLHLLERIMSLHEAGANCADCDTCGEQIDTLAELVASGTASFMDRSPLIG